MGALLFTLNNKHTDDMKTKEEIQIALLAEGLKHTMVGTDERDALIDRHVVLAERHGHSICAVLLKARELAFGKVAA